MEKIRYNHLNSYLKNKFGKRTLKICVDGGFTCPNRDGSKGIGGCAFCGEMGAGENIKHRQDNVLKSIESQVLGFLNSYRGERADSFIVYFQSFTNTYADLNILKERYDIALACSDKIVGLEVATRPDCINDDIARLLASYKDKYYVCVELGFQTANDSIGNLLNRGYTTYDFVRAVELLHRYNIDVVAHMMVGLPNETGHDIESTLRVINDCGCDGIKIHSVYVIKNSRLYSWYRDGKYTTITLDYYLNAVAYIVSNLNDSIIIHRINADPPKNIFVAPDWMLRKKVVINSINSKLNELDIIQGDRKIDITILD